MKTRFTLSLLMLLLAGGALSLAAQTGKPPPEPVEKPTVEQAQKTEITAPAVPAEKESVNSPTRAAKDAVDNTPFEYKPSEKISEDLSVSFPVDI